MALISNKKVVSRKNRRSIMEFAGIFKENADEWSEIEKEIYEDRKKLS